MMGDMLGEIGAMFWSLASVVLPFVGVALVLGVVAVVGVAAWWARPVDEPDPAPLIDRTASDWLGRP